MDLPRSVTRISEKDLEHVRRYLLQLTAAHRPICPRNDDIFQNDSSRDVSPCPDLCPYVLLKDQFQVLVFVLVAQSLKSPCLPIFILRVKSSPVSAENSFNHLRCLQMSLLQTCYSFARFMLTIDHHHHHHHHLNTRLIQDVKRNHNNKY